MSSREQKKIGSRAPAMSWRGEAWTNALEGVSKAFLSRCRHSRRRAGTRRLEKPTDRAPYFCANSGSISLDCRIDNAIIHFVQQQQGASTHMPANLWQPGQSGNPAGRLRGSRNKLSEEVVCALLRDFRKHGEKAIAKVRRDQPGIYLKVLALLIPRQDKLEHTNTIKTM